ncbi:uncharacterized protein LOC131948064 [Physella acuta]|uniref:uncharacterized protein LOC131948064 n=1 Tax=Physella acuta TaxID=109671 RepID=UPI0027DC8CC1|nr:uncharacterized protein LOC131948064 [Physella acuta]
MSQATNLGEYVMKVILVGDSGVGKTSLLLRYADDTFSQGYITTIGVDFRIRTLEAKGVQVKMHLWDTAGQDRFRNIVSSFYRGANGLAFVFDLTDMESFQNVSRWVQEAQQYGGGCCAKLLVGNKADLQHVVSREAALSLATAIGAQYIEASAKDATNVQQVFTNMADMWVEQLQEERITAHPQRPPVSISSHRVHGYGCLGSDSCSTL